MTGVHVETREERLREEEGRPLVGSLPRRADIGNSRICSNPCVCVPSRYIRRCLKAFPRFVS